MNDLKRVMVAMSGGVDSSVAAYLLCSKGYDCVGSMMKLYENTSSNVSDSACCSVADAEDARAVAALLDIPFFVFNFTDNFNRQVIQRFIDAYQNGSTPNPCIDCNRFMKFQRFLQRATEMDCEYIATGHYAQIICSTNGRYLLKKGVDDSKDQSYALYSMTQEQLSRTLFPLGDLTKSQVRELALSQGLVTAKKRDSQDICFAPDKDYAGFIERYTNISSKKGRFINKDGDDLGEHNGIIHYTIGQRKGLGLHGPNPLYVCSICPENNTVVVGASEELYSSHLTACDINLIPIDKLDGSLRVQARVRYRQSVQLATVWQTGDDSLHVEFDNPQRAITKGQAIVLYDGEDVIGGGTIT